MSVTFSNGQIRPIQPDENIVIIRIYSHIISISYMASHSNTKTCQVVLWIFLNTTCIAQDSIGYIPLYAGTSNQKGRKKP